ncbi:putative oxidoreductase [Synechococcus sp. MIT S9509]|uniref:NAD(P)/FAD-dependent oxidoreductase n=1 Tax=unclassified Synechococcus TaxID=2626047 RepID=UPI0007BC7FAC|nr:MULTISPECIES: NAD(P)/FAD-dependent oxidoreductase [unclassified Synechococcus]KZR85738.1 putative oxidoreductase [Synechococcus sp. MIT S9504]KZR93707.1 putative oxidoreductase [Synechococcus sp. MIT S9509]
MQFPDLDTDVKKSSAPFKRRVQVLIVGLGPAGTACGMGLAKSGLEVLAIDRAHFPRDKICGDALTGDALRFLRENNIPSRIIQRSVSETRKPSYAELTPTLAEASGYSLEGTGLRTREASFHSIRRIDLDNWLVECCTRAGLPMEFGWQVQSLHRHSSSDPWCVSGTIRSREGQVQGKFEITAEVVVGCDGVSSVVQNLTREQHAARPIALASRRYSRRDEVDTPDVSLMDYQWPRNPSYAWRFSVNGGTNAGIYWCHHRDIPPLSGRDLLALTRQHAPRGDAIRTWGIPVLTDDPLPQSPLGILLTGDAASLVDPMIGHGIDRAIHSGELAGQILSKGFQTGCTVETITRTYENNLESRRVEWQRSFKEMDNMIGGIDRTVEQFVRGLLRSVMLPSTTQP